MTEQQLTDLITFFTTYFILISIIWSLIWQVIYDLFISFYELLDKLFEYIGLKIKNLFNKKKKDD